MMQTTPPSAFLRVKKGPFFSSCIPTFGVAAAGPPLTRCCLTVSLIAVPLDAPCATSPVRRSRWRPRCVDDGLGPGPAPRQPSQRNRNHGHAPVTVRRGLMLCHGHPLAVDVPALLLKYVQFFACRVRGPEKEELRMCTEFYRFPPKSVVFFVFLLLTLTLTDAP